MFNIKALAVATAVSAGAVFAMPVATQAAMPVSGPVKIHTSNDGNVVDVKYRKHWNRWARYCAYNDDWRCHRRYSRYNAYRYNGYRYYGYDEPYYGYYRPYYRHRYYGPGVGLQFNID
jgi:hypothetical protein